MPFNRKFISMPFELTMVHKLFPDFQPVCMTSKILCVIRCAGFESRSQSKSYISICIDICDTRESGRKGRGTAADKRKVYEVVYNSSDPGAFLSMVIRAVKLEYLNHISLPTDIRYHVVLIEAFSFLIPTDFGRIDLNTSQSEHRCLLRILLLALPLFFQHSPILETFDALVIQSPLSKLLLVLVKSRTEY